MVDFDIVKSMEHICKYLKHRITITSATASYLSFKANKTKILNYKIFGNTVNINGKLVNVGDLVIDPDDPDYGKYKITVMVNNREYNIFLDEPLRKNGNSVDYIDFINQKIYRKVRSRKLTGSEDNWTASSSYPGGFFMNWANLGGIARGEFLCSSAQYVSDLSEYLFGTCFSDNSMNIRIMQPGTLLQNWKDFLLQHYSSNNPIEIQYTSASTSVQSLNLPELSIKRGSNTISVNTEIAPSLIEITR